MTGKGDGPLCEEIRNISYFFKEKENKQVKPTNQTFASVNKEKGTEAKLHLGKSDLCC